MCIRDRRNLLSKVGIWKRFHDEKLGYVSIDDPFVLAEDVAIEGAIDPSGSDSNGELSESVDADESSDSQDSEEE